LPSFFCFKRSPLEKIPCRDTFQILICKRISQTSQEFR